MNYQVNRLTDTNTELAQTLKNFCYEVNGACFQVHREMGPFLNEYMYQEALDILLEENNIEPKTKEYYFSVDFHGRRISHKHYVDFLVKDKILIECKAVDCLGSAQRQQLWNYMRLTRKQIGILVNFAPVKIQCEHYYLDTVNNVMYTF